MAFHKKKYSDLQKTQQVEKSERPVQPSRSASVGKNLVGVEHQKVQKAKPTVVDSSEIDKLKQNVEVLEYAKSALTKKLRVELEFWQNKCARL